MYIQINRKKEAMKQHVYYDNILLKDNYWYCIEEV